MKGARCLVVGVVLLAACSSASHTATGSPTTTTTTAGPTTTQGPHFESSAAKACYQILAQGGTIDSCPPNTGSTTRPTRSTEVSSAAWFAGEWAGHSLELKLDRAGRGTMLWRTYKTCGTDPPPCDTFRGNTIDSGGHATLLVTKYATETASGRVITSTDQAELPIGQFSLRLAANGMMTLSPWAGSHYPLCGPNTPNSACPY
jgi:hypothetical protein